VERTQNFKAMKHWVEETLSNEAEGFLHQVSQPLVDETTQSISRVPALHLLVPVGSEQDDSTALFWAAADLANRLSLQVTILHCREWDLAKGVKYFMETQEEATSIITSATKWFSALNIQVHGVLCDVERGSIGKAIAATSIDYHADSILVGLRQKRRLLPGLMGSTVAQVERLVDCPVIIIKINKHQ
jgi:nucleotide-binding universal stress UspA family protein